MYILTDQTISVDLKFAFDKNFYRNCNMKKIFKFFKSQSRETYDKMINIFGNSPRRNFTTGGDLVNDESVLVK